ncbi:MAG: ABC transporter permease [Vicinamibacteraceae bacterium]
MVFADRHRDASNAWQRLQVWLQAVIGVLREAPKEHVRMILHDLRFAVRTARGRPGFTLTAVLTLALGIGANTAIFQLIDAVRLRTLPVHEPNELAEVSIVGGNGGFLLHSGRYEQLTRPIWEELRRHQQAFVGLFAWATFDVRVGERPDLRRAHGLYVTGDFFRVLGVRPSRGRLIEPADARSACPSSQAVVSHAYWLREMGGRALSADTRITVNGERLEVVGVTPPEFFGVAVGERFDIAIPFCQPEELRRDVFDIAVMGRLRPGWTIERASAHLQALSAGIMEATAPTGYSTSFIERFKAFRLAAYRAAAGVSWLRTQYDTSLRLLLGLTSLVLMLACANLANLLLARASTRDREVAVRLALGASRGTLVRQFLAESYLLAAIGAVLGVGIAHLLSRVLVRALSTTEGAPILSLAIDWRVLLFTAVVASATCILFGMAPARRAAHIQPAAAMSMGGRGMTAGRTRFATQRVMVVTQIAVSLILLVAALLFVRSFHNLMTFDPGMRRDGIAFGVFEFDDADVAPERVSDFTRQLLAEVESIPGILDAATTTHVPLIGGAFSHGISVGANEGWSRFTWVSPGYFETMDIPILQGRDFNLRDTRSSPRVAIVNETFVRQLVGSANPIGRPLRTSPEPGYPATTYEIVGVIPDTRYNDLRGETEPTTFAPDSQCPPQGPWTNMMIRSSVDPAVAIASIKQRLRRMHPEIVTELSVLEWRIHDGLVRERLLAMLAGFFGALAAVLAMVGLYGMISFAVAQRRQEIGIRIALGAHRRQVLGMVMREAAWLLVVGIAIGAGLSLLVGRGAASLLFGLTPYDPLTLVAASLFLTLVATGASFVPARAAARLEPLTALRRD